MSGNQPIARISGVLPAAASLGVLVGWLLLSPGIVPALLVAAAPAVAAVCLEPRARRATAVILLASVPIFSGVALVTTSPDSLARRVDDVFLLLGTILLLRQWRLFPTAFRRPALAAAGALLASELAGLAGGWVSLGLTFGAAWQDIRWVGAIGLGLALGQRFSRDECRRWALALLVGWNVVNLAVSVFQLMTNNILEHRLGIPVATGAFGHPTFGAITGTCLFLYIAADRLSDKRRIGDEAALGLLALAASNLVVSVRLKAFLAIAAGLIFLMLQGRHRRKPMIAAAFAAIPLLVVPLIGLSQDLKSNVQFGGQNVFADTASHASPRLSLLTGAKRLASEDFPFGSGLGTFGSNLSPRVEDVTFTEAGIGSVFGLSEEDPSFRSDSQVAHTLAERGYLGMALWILGLSLVLVAAVRLRAVSLYPATALVAAISAAAVSPSLMSGPAIYMFLLPAGLELATGVRGPPGAR